MRRLLLALSLASASFANAELMNVQQLNQLLKKQKAGWTAKSTAIGQLSRPEVQHRMGLRMDEPVVQFEIPQVKTRSNLPSKLDWREKEGFNWVSPILDQGNCGSCVAFATIGVLETQYKIATGFAGFNIKLSPQNAFACGGGACDFGWFPEAAARFLQRTGVPDEACMPYTSGATGQDVACSMSCADTPRRSVRVSSYTTPTRHASNVEAVKQALQHGPLVTTLGVYEDFMLYGGGVYKHTTGDMLGGHAISIIGYDDSERAYIIRNSWGETWGEGGFGRVSYDDISGVGSETWSYAIPSLNGAVSIEAPLDYTYASGTAPVKVHSTFSATDTLTVSFFNNAGTAVMSTTCKSQDCDKPMDVSTLPDGRYEVQAVATDRNGQELAKSARQFFYVANQKPALDLSFVGTKGTDLNKPLRDRIVIAVSASSSTVPMSSVEFHYKGADGVDHSRAAEVVINGMTMGWRTNLVPNGNYEIWLSGRVKTNTQETAVETPHLSVQVAN